MSDYSYHNARNVLAAVSIYIDRGVKLPIRACYDALSIFDWWPNDLSISNAKKMKSFLKNAINMGFDGYVCFKVGASGCANGMWAYKAESINGYSPDGDVLYRSFTPDYTYWNAEVNGAWLAEKNGLPYDGCKRFKDLEALLAKE